MNGAYLRCRVHGHYAPEGNSCCPLCRRERKHPERLTEKQRNRQFNAMKAYAMPMIEEGMDWQKVQWEVLNEFDFLTNSEEDGERIMDVIRECEAKLEEPII